MTMRERHLKYLTRTHIVTFWGQRYRITPRLVSKILGDGKKIIHFTPLATRPDYYIIRVDSQWDLDNGGKDSIYDHLEELYNAIEDDYGNYFEEWQHDNGRTYIKHHDFPALNIDCGSSWGEMISAKEALSLTECNCAFVARAYFIEVVKQLKELDGIIARLEKEGK